ncbi:CLUMA_CG015544, isoform A [Clunio marinus]|uniref:CLUMA_CG015544, isoform A n=1 Tax=Clunio marinus TaxID=568069 RepID=A0A1J1IRT6_9DIPT|nr:CLUMA_CG015544, isoform A [Clunio marinus]
MFSNLMKIGVKRLHRLAAIPSESMLAQKNNLIRCLFKRDFYELFCRCTNNEMKKSVQRLVNVSQQMLEEC